MFYVREISIRFEAENDQDAANKMWQIDQDLIAGLNATWGDLDGKPILHCEGREIHLSVEDNATWQSYHYTIKD